MTKTIYTTLIAILLVNLAFSQEEDKYLIKHCFNNFKIDMSSPVENTDTRTIKYYDNLLQKVKYSDSLAIERLDVFDKIKVLSIRLELIQMEIIQEEEYIFVKEYLLSMNGKDLLAKDIDNEEFKTVLRTCSIGDLEIYPEFAKGNLISTFLPNGYYLDFHKENGYWKLDMTTFFTIQKEYLMSFMKFVGYEGKENEYFIKYILNPLENEKSKEVIDRLWKPIIID